MGIIINNNVQMFIDKSNLNKTKKIVNHNDAKSELEKKLDSYKYFSDNKVKKSKIYFKSIRG